MNDTNNRTTYQYATVLGDGDAVLQWLVRHGFDCGDVELWFCGRCWYLSDVDHPSEIGIARKGVLYECKIVSPNEVQKSECVRVQSVPLPNGEW
jgi:hypothetical protein